MKERERDEEDKKVHKKREGGEKRKKKKQLKQRFQQSIKDRNRTFPSTRCWSY